VIYVGCVNRVANSRATHIVQRLTVAPSVKIFPQPRLVPAVHLPENPRDQSCRLQYAVTKSTQPVLVGARICGLGPLSPNQVMVNHDNCVSDLASGHLLVEDYLNWYVRTSMSITVHSIIRFRSCEKDFVTAVYARSCTSVALVLVESASMWASELRIRLSMCICFRRRNMVQTT
jgi:hypothetical protein